MPKQTPHELYGDLTKEDEKDLREYFSYAPCYELEGAIASVKKKFFFIFNDDGIHLTINTSNNYITVNICQGNITNAINDLSDGSNYIISKETGIITIEAEKYPRWGADLDDGQIRLNAVGEGVGFSIYLGDNIDSDYDAKITFVWYRVDVNNDTLSLFEYISLYMTNGTLNTNTPYNHAITGNACATDRWQKHILTIAGTDLVSNKILRGYYQLQEAGREIKIESISIQYNQKREEL